MKNIQLILTSPCAERWDEMQPSGAGRYCDSCEKNIVDLSTKSDAELLQFFNKKKDDVCGRLLSSQLNRELLLPSLRASWHWLLPLAVGAMLVSPSQANELKPFTVQSNPTDSLPNLNDTLPKLAIKATTVNGRVVDNDSGKGLAGVRITHKGFANLLAVTDSAGRFALKLEHENLSEVFTFYLIGFNRADWKITDGILVKLNIAPIMLGEISITSITPGPLYIISAGKKSCSMDAGRFHEVPGDWIEKVEVFKDAEATSLFGSKGANGVVFVKIKKAYAKQIDFSKND